MKIRSNKDKNYILDKAQLNDYNLTVRMYNIAEDFVLEFQGCPPDILTNFLVKHSYIDPVLKASANNIAAFTPTKKGLHKLDEMRQAHPQWFDLNGKLNRTN